MRERITHQLVTVQRLQEVKNALSGASAELFKRKTYALANIEAVLSPLGMTLLERVAEEQHYDLRQKEGAQQALEHTLRELSRVEIATITLAVDLPYRFLTEVQGMLEKQLEADMVLEVQVDRRIGAGLMLWWRGSYYDFSAQKALFA